MVETHGVAGDPKAGEIRGAHGRAAPAAPRSSAGTLVLAAQHERDAQQLEGGRFQRTTCKLYTAQVSANNGSGAASARTARVCYIAASRTTSPREA